MNEEKNNTETMVVYDCDIENVGFHLGGYKMSDVLATITLKPSEGEQKTAIILESNVIERLFKEINSIQTHGFDSYTAFRRLVTDDEILMVASQILKNHADRLNSEAERIEKFAKEI